MEKKLRLLLLLSLLIPMMANAQTLVLHHANGSTTDVELLTQPQVKFQNDKVLISSTVINMEYPKEDVLTFTFKGKGSSISTPKGNVDFSKENGQLVFYRVKALDKIAVYNLKGIRIPVSIHRSGDKATLPLSSIPSGVYLLNVNGKTSKFTKL